MVERLLSLIKLNEGLRLSPYLCTAGKRTVGYGHNIDVKSLVGMYGITSDDQDITLEQATMALMDDVDDAIAAVRRNIQWFDKIDDNAKIVLVDMTFNLGITRLLKFKKMLAALEAGDNEEAARQIRDSLYFRQVTNRAKRNIDLILGSVDKK